MHTEYIELGSVRITDLSIAEMQNGRPIIEVSKAQILKVELRTMVAAERPLIQFFFGIILMLPGIYFSRLIWDWLIEGGTLYIDLPLACILLIPAGLWIAVSAFKRQILFHVYTADGSRKILCDRELTETEIGQFASNANQRFGYSIRNLLQE